VFSNTLELRKNHGKFTPIEADLLPQFAHVSCCQACGSDKPEHLYGVKSTNGMNLLVGSKCAAVLTSGKNPKVDDLLKGTGESYTDGSKTVIYVTHDWIEQAVNACFRGGYTFTGGLKSYYARLYVNDRFLAGMIEIAEKTGKLSDKQFAIANKIVASLIK
jgi:hypothetical protein